MSLSNGTDARRESTTEVLHVGLLYVQDEIFVQECKFVMASIVPWVATMEYAAVYWTVLAEPAIIS